MPITDHRYVDTRHGKASPVPLRERRTKPDDLTSTMKAEPRMPGVETYTLLGEGEEHYLRNSPDAAPLRAEIARTLHVQNEMIVQTVRALMAGRKLTPSGSLLNRRQPQVEPGNYYTTGVEFKPNGTALVRGYLFTAEDAARMLLHLVDGAPYPGTEGGLTHPDRPEKVAKKLRALTPSQRKALLALIDA